MLFLLSFSLDAFASTCPAGYISYDYGTNLLIDAQCPTGTTQIGEVSASCDNKTECFTDYLCNAGFSKINTSVGVLAPLYSQKVTSPSLNIAVDNGQCYTPLVAGTVAGAINVLHNDSVYHTATLKQCMLGFDAGVR